MDDRNETNKQTKGMKEQGIKQETSRQRKQICK
jgi:hypothetical protein